MEDLVEAEGRGNGSGQWVAYVSAPSVYKSPPTATSTAEATLSFVKNCGAAITPTHPTSRYTGAVTHLGASIQLTLRTTPSAAPAHTHARRTAGRTPEKASSANGVYVPAMKTKIIEWSTLRAHARARAECQGRRW